MNDLNQIRRANNEAVQRDIPNQLSKGKFVAAEYAGLHFIGYHAYDTLEAAAAIAAEINARGDSSHAKAPTQHPIATERDSLATAA